jgi:hypothetical protein
MQQYYGMFFYNTNVHLMLDRAKEAPNRHSFCPTTRAKPLFPFDR